MGLALLSYLTISRLLGYAMADLSEYWKTGALNIQGYVFTTLASGTFRQFYAH